MAKHIFLYLTLCCIAVTITIADTACTQEECIWKCTATNWQAAFIDNSGTEPVLVASGGEIPRQAMGIRITGDLEALLGERRGTCNFAELIPEIADVAIIQVIDSTEQHISLLFRPAFPRPDDSEAGLTLYYGDIGRAHVQLSSPTPAMIDNYGVDMLMIIPFTAPGTYQFKVVIKMIDASSYEIDLGSINLI